MTYPEVVAKLSIESVCWGGCGLSDTIHRGRTFLGVLHFSDRRMSRRGLRHFLLFVARRERLASPDFLNDDRRYFGLYLYLDEMKANAWAAQLGVRFPISYSLPERRVVALMPGLSRRHPAIYAWARRSE